MKSEERITTKTRRRYTEDFKAEAVRLVRDSARSVAKVAWDLGIADLCCTADGQSSAMRNLPGIYVDDVA
jgi:hypothetical protein